MPRRTDKVSPATRSAIMRAVRSRGNRATELVLVRLLRQYHLVGWRRGFRLAGNPDFVFQKARVAVFVDGCFWHGCRRHCRMPKGNRAYWRKKLAGNKTRDRLVTRRLRAAGWRVLRVWEHELVDERQARLVNKLRKALAPQSSSAFSTGLPAPRAGGPATAKTRPCGARRIA